MKTVKDACALQPNALSITLSDQVEQLDALIEAEGGGEAFFERTWITQGMETLISEGTARLAGASSNAIFHLKQAMGGGKTHLLIGFGLLARHPELRAARCPHISHINDFSSANIAAFNGRNTPKEFFWGTVANQLGKGELFKEFWAAGPKAPDESDWLHLFEGDEPILILLDEMPPYFDYLNTQAVGNGTVADIALRAFAGLLTAAGRRRNVCVVISDLAAAYTGGTAIINRALDNARAELGRQERPIMPVDLATGEVYDILRKRLFAALPDHAVIGDVAAAYGRKLEEAAKAKTAGRGAEAIADHIAHTYPFHPELKHIIALFKENEQFKQTRGLIELISRLLKSVWERSANDVFLIGPQHFDLSIPAVRDKLTEISAMRDVVAKDLWDVESSAHAQLIDLEAGSDAGTQVGSLLFSASLSTAVNAVKGLTREEMVECLVSPLTEPSAYLAAFDALENKAWYLHHTPEGRYYFDRQENLTKLLEQLATEAPQPLIDEVIDKRLREMFDPSRKTAYGEVIPLPRLADVADRVRHGRILIIVNPDLRMPPEEVQRFFEGLSQKNNLCVLTGGRTSMASLDQAARELYAAQRAEKRIGQTHPQREDLDRKLQTYEQFLLSTVLSLFDQVLFPVQRGDRPPELRAKPLDQTRDTNQPFKGEEQIEKTLTTDPLKLYLDVEAEFDPIRDRAEDLLWPANQDEARWTDVVDRYAEQAGMPWLPPKGLDHVKSLALSRGRWEDLGNGYISKRPKRKSTSVQVVPDGEPDDTGRIRLRVSALNAGPAPRIHYAEGGAATVDSRRLTDLTYETAALRVTFLAVDPSGQHETGAPVTWENTLVLRNRLFSDNGKRKVELLVAPTGAIRYTLDGSEPRDGHAYTEPVAIGDEAVLLRAFAEADGLEAKADFRFPAKGEKGPRIEPAKPARLSPKAPLKFDSRAQTFAGLSAAKDAQVTFENVTVTAGQGEQMIALQVGKVEVDAPFIEQVLSKLLDRFAPDTAVVMSFRQASFRTGHDLVAFAGQFDFELRPGEVEQ
jgi:Protein of unknown function (DUF499)/Fn3 associated